MRGIFVDNNFLSPKLAVGTSQVGVASIWVYLFIFKFFKQVEYGYLRITL